MMIDDNGVGDKWGFNRSESSSTPPTAPRCPYEVGGFVSWQAQEGIVTERILRITEPQPGNYVLWTTLKGKEKFGDLPADFPINYREVTRADKTPPAATERARRLLEREIIERGKL